MRRALGLGLALVLLLSANSGLAKGKNKKDSLYNHLGKKEGITAVVDDFVGRCAKDDRINSFFAATAADPKRLANFKGKLVAQICEAAGGKCKYRGKSMKAAHAGMGIRAEHFDALVEDLQASLNQFNVKPADQKKLLAVLGPMKKQIVEPARNTASEGK